MLYSITKLGTGMSITKVLVNLRYGRGVVNLEVSVSGAVKAKALHHDTTSNEAGRSPELGDAKA